MLDICIIIGLMVFSNTSFSTLQLRHRTSSLSSPTPEPTNLFLFLEVMGGVSAFPLIGERSLLLLASPRSLCSPRSTLSSSKSSSSSLGSIKNQKKASWYFFFWPFLKQLTFHFHEASLGTTFLALFLPLLCMLNTILKTFRTR